MLLISAAKIILYIYQLSFPTVKPFTPFLSCLNAERLETCNWSHRKVCEELREFKWWVFNWCCIFDILYIFLTQVHINLSELLDRLARSADIGKDDSQILNPKRSLEEEYLDYEAKVKTQIPDSNCCILIQNGSQIFTPYVMNFSWCTFSLLHMPWYHSKTFFWDILTLPTHIYKVSIYSLFILYSNNTSSLFIIYNTDQPCHQ